MLEKKILSISRCSGIGGIVKVGCFDILHIGHIQMFERCKELGSPLVVLVGADELLLRLGKTPYFDEDNRMKMVASIYCVDYVVKLYDEDHTDSLKIIKPNKYHIPRDDPDFENKIKMLTGLSISPIIDDNTVVQNFHKNIEPHSFQIKKSIYG